MMSIYSSDLYALIISFSSMKDQLRWSRVSRSWKHLVANHPSVFNLLDFTDCSLKYQFDLIERLFTLGVTRVRILLITIPILYYQNHCSFLQRFPNLVRILIFGHLEYSFLKEFMAMVIPSSLIPKEISFVSCSCLEIPIMEQMKGKSCSAFISFPSPLRYRKRLWCLMESGYPLRSYCRKCEQDFENPPCRKKCCYCSTWLVPLIMSLHRNKRFVKNYAGYRLEKKSSVQNRIINL